MTEATVDLSALGAPDYDREAQSWMLDGKKVEGHRDGPYFDGLEDVLLALAYHWRSLPDRLFLITPGQPGGSRCEPILCRKGRS